MSDIRDMAIAFEGKKVSVNQNKDGVIMRIAIHPHDVPRRIWTDDIGTRYQFALVQIGDGEEPDAPPETVAASRAIQSAGMLCRNTAFHAFLRDQGYMAEGGEAEAAAVLRELLGVESRREFHDNPSAVTAFEELKGEFMVWRTKNPHNVKTERGSD